jgi:hypothetical protein
VSVSKVGGKFRTTAVVDALVGFPNSLAVTEVTHVALHTHA